MLLEKKAQPARVYIKATDDPIFGMFGTYPYVTLRQAHEILGCKWDWIENRLPRLTEGEYLNRVQVNAMTDFLYFITKKGAQYAVSRGEMQDPWYSQSKAITHIEHEKGTTAFQIGLLKQFPGAKTRRYRADLQRDFPDDVPDLLFDIGDGKEECPFEYVRENPVSVEKLAYYHENFRRSYIALPTQKYLLHFLRKIEDELPYTDLWFTYEDAWRTNFTGTIWWTPADFTQRARSIIKPNQ